MKRTLSILLCAMLALSGCTKAPESNAAVVPTEETEEIVGIEDSEYISEKTKKRKYINGTIIQDERKSEEAGKRFLDFMIYGSFLLLIVLVVLFITGVI